MRTPNEAGALDAEAGLGGNPVRILELLAIRRSILDPVLILFADRAPPQRGSQLTLRWRKADSNHRSRRERNGRGEGACRHRRLARGPELNTGPSWSFRDLPLAKPGRPFRKSGAGGSNPLSSSGESCKPSVPKWRSCISATPELLRPVAPRADGAAIARQLVSEILGVAVAQDLGPKDIMPETTRREADRGIAPEHAEAALSVPPATEGR